MITSSVMAAIVGAVLKLIFMWVSTSLANKREERIANSHADESRTNAIIALQKDERSYAHYIRPVIALIIVGTFAFIVIWYTINPDVYYVVFKDKNPGLFKWVFGGKDYERVLVTGTQITQPFWDLVFMVASFYFLGDKNGKN